MDQWLASSQPWPLKFAACLAGGLVVALLILSIPKQRLARLGKTAPNWISLIRFPVFWCGALIFLGPSPFWGFLCVVAACILDVVDGKSAVALAEAGIERSRLDRWIGEWLDPLIDKLTILPLLAIMSWRGQVDWRIAGAIIVIDAVGTLIRDPITMLPAIFKYPGLKLADRILAELDRREREKPAESKNRASPMGKIKALVQCFGLIACMPGYLRWAHAPRIQDWILVSAILLGIMSPLSRVRISMAYDQLMARIAPYFGHKDVL